HEDARIEVGPATPPPVLPVGEGDITDDEFEQLLDAISDDSPVAALPAASLNSEEISDDEFEALLDQLHGHGKGPGAKAAPAKSSAPAESPAPVVSASPAASTSTSEEITDDEFEALLDQLHGKGKGPTKVTADKPVSPNAAAPSGPASAPAKAPQASATEHMGEDEFEALLDQLHGVGKAPTSAKAPASTTAATSTNA